MYSNEREKEIMNILSQNAYATVEYLAEKIHISPSSIRRDLKRLEMKGLVSRSYGGAEIKNSVNKQIPFFLRSHKNTKEKAIVASKAASLVRPGDVVFLDSSTSTYFCVEHLKNIKNIPVITNSLASMTACSEFYKRVFCRRKAEYRKSFVLRRFSDRGVYKFLPYRFLLFLGSVAH